jgi:hypothetical protein
MKAKLFATIAVLATTAVAAADSVEMRFVNAGPGRAVTIRIDGEQYRVHAGQLNHEVLSRSGDTAPATGMLATYCVDVGEWVNTSSRTYDVAELVDAPVGSVGNGMSQDAADAIGRLYTFANGRQFTDDRNFSAAFQIAVWEVVADLGSPADTLDLSEGSFKAWNLNQGTMGHVSSLLAVATNSSILVNRRVRALTNDGAQDQMFEVAVPLPTTGALAAVGLAGAGLITRRRRA